MALSTTISLASSHDQKNPTYRGHENVKKLSLTSSKYFKRSGNDLVLPPFSTVRQKPATLWVFRLCGRFEINIIT